MKDPYFKVVQENWVHILFLYNEFEDKKPVMLFDIQEGRVYAYPYHAFLLDLNKRSQELLKDQYAGAIANDQMVVFVRDNDLKKLVSYTLNIN
jgi:hypothetical protein